MRLFEKNIVNHIDENKQNYHLDNLEWCTTRENIIHSIGKKLEQIDPKTNKIINIFSNVKDAHNYCKKGSGSRITEVCNGTRELAYGYKWKWSQNK